MGLFRDDQDVYATVGRLFTDLAGDERVAADFARANTIVRYAYTDPDAQITISLREGQPVKVDLGESELEPEVTMSMSADVGHRFWLGGVNVTVALARGEIRATGPVAKILRLVPLAKPIFPRYRAQLESQGRADLIAAAAEDAT